MKKIITLALFAVILLSACNSSDKGSSSSSSTTPSTSSTPGKPFVAAKIDGQDWLSDGDNILITYSDIDDRLYIHTTDNAGKQDFLIGMEPFSKTQVGSYSSSKEKGFGISLLDTDNDNATQLAFDNFTQGSTADCVKITSIKDIDGKQQWIEGTFASNMTPSFDAAGKKGKAVEGKFGVIAKKQ